MTERQWRIPRSTLTLLETVPKDRAVACLLRHSVRDDLPPGDVGYDLPITEVGRALAIELGKTLRGRLRTLHTSPLARCVQTAEALVEGASDIVPVVIDHSLGDPGAFVVDAAVAWTNWETLGHEGVMRHLVEETEALPGMARPADAARALVHSMLASTTNVPGLHVFVTHDLLVTATVARFLRTPFARANWPDYLEGAFFWQTTRGIHAAYRGDECVQPIGPSGGS